MPTYEYRCANGHEFDAFQSMSDDPLTECPECGADAERLISAGAGLVFKGSGFYITENRSESYKESAEAERGGENGSDDGGSKGDSDAASGSDASSSADSSSGSTDSAE